VGANATGVLVGTNAVEFSFNVGCVGLKYCLSDAKVNFLSLYAGLA